MNRSLESDIFVDQTGPSEVESTFELPSDEPVAIHRRPENIAKCERRAIAYKVKREYMIFERVPPLMSFSLNSYYFSPLAVLFR